MSRLSELPVPRPDARDGRGADEPSRLCAPPAYGRDEDMGLPEARAAIMRPAIGEAELREACRVLRSGDWLDQQRADLILALLDDPATAPEPVPDQDGSIYEIALGIEWQDVVGAIAIFALLIAGMWVAWGFGF